MGKRDRNEGPQYGLCVMSVVMGAAILFFVVVNVRDTRSFTSRAVSTTGVVTRLVPSTGRGHGLYPHFKFRTLDGRTITHTDQVTRTIYSVGDQVAVRYDPQEPTRAYADYQPGTRGEAIGWSVVGVALIAFGVRMGTLPKSPAGAA